MQPFYCSFAQRKATEFAVFFVYLGAFFNCFSMSRFGGLHSMTSLDSVLLGILESDIPQVLIWIFRHMCHISSSGAVID